MALVEIMMIALAKSGKREDFWRNEMKRFYFKQRKVKKKWKFVKKRK